jgi:hypothetical protein
MLRILPLCLLLIASAAPAARLSVDATNPGAIDGSGRELVFNLSTVNAPIAAARLELDISYTRARELELSLVDASGSVQLTLADFAGLDPSIGLSGRYRIDDRAPYPWLYAAAAASVRSLAPVQAYQFGQAGLCVNLVGRYLEYDIDTALPLTLRIARAAGASGTGSITRARLVVDTNFDESIHASGFEEIETIVERCQRPSFDVVVNGGNESLSRSPLTLLDYAAGAPDWRIRQYDPPADFGPFAFGTGATTQPYPGRFGGRSRMNLGFWDASTGTLNFSTGTGARTLALPGDWNATQHVPIPGDYDGDGTTDLAIAFLGEFGGQPRWIGRFLLSSEGSARDIPIDPRTVFPAQFDSPSIGFGSGQDGDGDGRDEVTIYARTSVGGMGLVQVQLQRSGRIDYFSGPFWGIAGDRMVLGNWLGGASGNRFGLMVVRKSAGVLEWYLHPNPTPVIWGFASDYPLSIDIDDDERNDIAVWRPSDQTLYAIRSSDGQQVSFAAFGAASDLPLAWLLGTTAPPEF